MDQLLWRGQASDGTRPVAARVSDREVGSASDRPAGSAPDPAAGTDPADAPDRADRTEPDGAAVAAGPVAGPAAGPVVGVGSVAGVGPAVAVGRAPGDGAVVEPAGRSVRRRGKALEDAIFEATLNQLTSGGYARLTMEGVAGAARTGKAALYRRWASKEELVLDALDSTLPRATQSPELGSARSELLQLIADFCAAVNSPAGGAMNVLMAELDHQQAEVFKDFIVNRVMEPTKLAILDILRRGEERGDVRPGAADPLVADVVPAMLLYRVKVCGRNLVGNFAESLVDDVMVPLIRRID